MNYDVHYNTFKVLEKYFQRKIYDFSVEAIFGDASGREYFRVTIEDKTYILMHIADITSPEFGRGDSFHDFFNMQQHLQMAGITVPEIFYKNDSLRIMLIEDLGDTTLYSLLRENKKQKINMIKKALDVLISWQVSIYNRKNFTSPGDKKIFKQKLFMDEFYHFHEYMVEKRCYYPSPKGIWNKAKGKFKEISKELSSSPYILSHRDFQSKNIMFKNDKIYLIDFQDALMAPAVYDLVSLLRDSYTKLTKNELSILLDYFWENNPIMQDIYIEKERFLYLFHLQTIQRKMKDAGRFIYLHAIKNKDWFIQFVHPTLYYVRDSLMELDMAPLCNLYSRFVPELATGGK